MRVFERINRFSDNGRSIALILRKNHNAYFPFTIKYQKLCFMYKVFFKVRYTCSLQVHAQHTSEECVTNLTNFEFYPFKMRCVGPTCNYFKVHGIFLKCIATSFINYPHNSSVEKKNSLYRRPCISCPKIIFFYTFFSLIS